jgi:hypothetical protein
MDNMQGLTLELLEGFVVIGKSIHLPTMLGVFVLGVITRFVVHKTIARHAWFGREFENRVTDFLHKENAHKSSDVSFYVLSKRLLEKTYYEIFARREQHRRAKFDTLILGDDRLFLTKFGCAWFVRELLKQIRFLQYSKNDPKLVNVTRSVLSKNPAFGRVFGLVNASAVNDFLNILPGLFVIGGIFGTFLGVMHGLPELSGMDLNDPAKTKTIMDQFLGDVALSMGASVTGIFLSVCMTLINTAWSPERTYGDMVDRFENSLDLLWNYSTNNEVPSNLKPFSDNLDTHEALAEAAVSQEYDRLRGKYEDGKGPKSA